VEKYRVELTASAEKALHRLSPQALPKILQAIQTLAINPFPQGCRKLTGQQDIYRIRVQVYRIIYEVHEDVVLVKVLKIGHRKDVYR